MNINFNDATYEKMKFLATREGKSVAAYVSQTMDRITSELVNVEYTYTAEEDAPKLDFGGVIQTPLHLPPRQVVGNYEIRG